MIQIDGAFGEGGGQILRSSLSLSIVTGKAFKISNIRAHRKKGGLLRQHLTAVKAAQAISNAHVVGAEIGSKELEFYPEKICHGSYTFAVGTAGSCTLVFQTILPGLIKGTGSSEILFEGGTHNPMAPPFHFLNDVFLDVLSRMGFKIKAELIDYGFYPAGGGTFKVSINAVEKGTSINLLEKGPLCEKSAVCTSSQIPYKIAKREAKIIANKLKWEPEQCKAITVKSIGPGNIVMIKLKYKNVTELFTGFGMRGVRLTEVVNSAVKDVKKYITYNAVVGKYLADQLLIPMVIAGSGSFITGRLTMHTKTNIEVIKRFINVCIECRKLDEYRTKISIKGVSP